MKVICNLCSSDNADRRLRQLGHGERDVWDAITSGVQKGLHSACNIQNVEVVIFEKC
jgi:hypothetical protein